MTDDLITDERKDELLEKTRAPRVTKEYMESKIVKTTFTKLPFTTTVTMCNIDLNNGFSVRGESACVNPANYNQEIGEKIAYDNAFSKLWAFYGFLLAELKELP